MAKDIAVDVSRRARGSGASERCPRVSRWRRNNVSPVSPVRPRGLRIRAETSPPETLESLRQPEPVHPLWESAVLSCFREKVFYRRPVCRRARATGWRTDRYGETWGRIRRNGVRAHPPRAPPRAGSAARYSLGKSSQPRPISSHSSLSSRRRRASFNSTRARDSPSPGRPRGSLGATAEGIFVARPTRRRAEKRERTPADRTNRVIIVSHRLSSFIVIITRPDRVCACL